MGFAAQTWRFTSGKCIRRISGEGSCAGGKNEVSVMKRYELFLVLAVVLCVGSVISGIVAFSVPMKVSYPVRCSSVAALVIAVALLVVVLIKGRGKK